ncbi:MAG: HAMP domain-containing histidine kinase [Synechococcales cyanobacterium RM1_1_8]|nr:HAMP domain-containing histidine kinase [Synechococcales cyanobacterium RM1_1_8]
MLMGLFLAAVPLMRYRVFAEVDARVRKDIGEELEFFEALRAGTLPLPERSAEDDPFGVLPRSRELTFNPNPRTSQELKGLMDAFLAKRIPEDDTFLIAVVEGQVYKSSPRALPQGLQPGQAILTELKLIGRDQAGEIDVPKGSRGEKLGDILYKTTPIWAADGTGQGTGDRPLGSLIIVHSTAGEREEALEALHQVTQVLSVLTLVGLGLGWLLSGRLLAPLRTLANTAQRVSESDLSQRLSVEGGGELADLAKTFNEMMGRLDLAFQNQRQLLNDAGHELRTPITIIRGHLELMESDPQEVEETRTLLLDELDRMGRLVNELILLAKSERPDFLHWETFELSTWLTELFAKVQALGDRRWQLSLDDGSLGGGGKIRGDRQRLTEALLNLADNAVRHTQPDDTITLGAVLEPQRLRLWVRDTGEGIAQADQDRIFERFCRGGKQRRSEGSGLGLAIVKAIAESHGGLVALESQLGQGSTFTLVLPLGAGMAHGF